MHDGLHTYCFQQQQQWQQQLHSLDVQQTADVLNGKLQCDCRVSVQQLSGVTCQCKQDLLLFHCTATTLLPSFLNCSPHLHALTD
jgi:hypothetical protein